MMTRADIEIIIAVYLKLQLIVILLSKRVLETGLKEKDQLENCFICQCNHNKKVLSSISHNSQKIFKQKTG